MRVVARSLYLSVWKCLFFTHKRAYELRVSGWSSDVFSSDLGLIKSVPEVDSVFGKVGRDDTATDPVPIGMFETTIRFKPCDEWRAGMTPDKLVEELDRVVRVPGLANVWVPPIRNRIDMLATGIKSPIGVKVSGEDLGQIGRAHV